MGNVKKLVKGRGVTPGYAEGRALMSKQSFMFAHGVDPRTGDIIDIHSDISGENIKGKIFIFPCGKGSTTGSAWFLETVRRGNGPSAVINLEAEPIIVTAIVMAWLLYGITIPLVDRLEKDITDMVINDAIIEVNADAGEVKIGPKSYEKY